jgi:4'-phosphopantetheinyl transferase EntD
MDVFWLEQRAADVPAHDDWLAPAELARLNSFRFPKRRSDWRLGRWTAKNTLVACLSLPGDVSTLSSIEIVAAVSGAPLTLRSGAPADFSITLSHSNDVAMCAVAAGHVSLGCDLELVERRSNEFISDYFTLDERSRIARANDRDTFVSLLWSAKESVLKALHEGLRLDTRSVFLDEVESSNGEDWSKLSLITDTGLHFHGYWRATGGFVHTIVADPPPATPIHLAVRNRLQESDNHALAYAHRSAD